VSKALDDLVVTMMKAAQEPLLLVDTERQLVWSNGAAGRFFRTTGEGLAGVRVDEVLAVPGDVVAEICRSVTVRGHGSGTIQIIAADGHTRAADFTAIALGSSLHLSTLREASPRRPRIAATVGHEIRGPLATALMYLDIAQLGRNGDEGTAVGPALAVARQQIERIESLVTRMLDLQTNGRPLIQPRLVDAGRVVSDAVRRSLALGPAAPVCVQIGPQDLTGWWDEGAIDQIVQNLVSNAVRFGEGRPVQVTADRRGGDLRLDVQDQGIGISPVDRERIFRRYVRGDRSDGLGIGLWLVRELARAHEGSVTLQSKVGAGSTFTVLLRPMPPAAVENEPAREHEA
jgi:signal transduction histidine kinase